MNIVLQNVSKKYGDKFAVSDFSAEFCHGEVTTLLGPSGCGKTTLLNIVAGIIKPSNGSMSFDGQNVDQNAIENYSLGYVFQNYSLYPDMSVYDNISFPLVNIRPKHIPRKEYKLQVRDKVLKIARLLKIDDLLDRLPTQLSGGQQQRIAIGRALVKEPDILLMDEPFANLDKQLAVELRDEIRSIQKKLGITLLFVTHNQNDATVISDKVVLMDKGKIQQIGRVEELYESPNNRFVAEFVGEGGINIMDRTVFNNEFSLKTMPIFNKEVSTVAFRPEHVNIFVSENDEENCFCVENVINNGYCFTVILRSRGGIAIRAFSNVSFATGSKVSVEIKKIFLFDKDGANMWL